MALGLGLHREPPADTPDSLFNERRRVVWWIVYCFDSGFSLTTGRPVMASDGFIETRLPRNIDDSVGCIHHGRERQLISSGVYFGFYPPNTGGRANHLLGDYSTGTAILNWKHGVS